MSSNPSRSGGRIFFSGVNFVCWLLFGVHSTPLLPQWHVKDPIHSAKTAGSRLLLNTHTPMTHSSWIGLTMPLSRQSVGIYQETSWHTTHQGTLRDSHLSWLCHCGLILAERVALGCASQSPFFFFSKRPGINCQTFSQNSCTWGKSHHHHHSMSVAILKLWSSVFSACRRH